MEHCPLQAFERELLALLPRLRRFARSLARDAADADDLVQAALERALKAREQWAPGTRLDAWMMRIVRNCWIDEARGRTRRGTTFVEEEEGARSAPMRIMTSSGAPSCATSTARWRRLPDEQREVIALVLVEGLRLSRGGGHARHPDRHPDLAADARAAGAGADAGGGMMAVDSAMLHGFSTASWTR